MTVSFCVPSDHRVVATRQWGRVEGLTLAPDGQTEGQREFLWLQPGFYVAMGQLVHRTDRLDRYPSGDFFKLHFRMAGHSRVGQANTPNSQDVLPHTMSTLVQPHDSYKEEHFAAGERERSLTICCSRDFLRGQLGVGDEARALDDPLSPYLSRVRRFELQQFPLHPEQVALVNALMDAPAADPYRGLSIESKASALLHGFLTGIGELQATGAKTGIAGAELARMAQLKRHLDAHLGEAIDLAVLARERGMTERRLANSFRKAYGKTVAAYLNDARMIRARLLLEMDQISVTEVAYCVGYGHVANFSTAFRRAFGVNPQNVRKDARAGDSRTV